MNLNMPLNLLLPLKLLYKSNIIIIPIYITNIIYMQMSKLSARKTMYYYGAYYFKQILILFPWIHEIIISYHTLCKKEYGLFWVSNYRSFAK